MRQVPHYLIVGRGRLATHLSHYFSLQGILFDRWDRQQSQSLHQAIQPRHTVLLAISDDAIAAFIEQYHTVLAEHTLIHFSGAMSHPEAVGCHPLMTFSDSLYEREFYEAIPFVLDQQDYTFQSLFPQLPNPACVISSEQKSMYHALCVLSGNATTVLWQSVFSRFEQELGLPKHMLEPYLDQITANLKQNAERALTGPWVRQDKSTIEKHRAVLSGDVLNDVYQSIYQLYRSQHEVDS